MEGLFSLFLRMEAVRKRRGTAMIRDIEVLSSPFLWMEAMPKGGKRGSFRGCDRFCGGGDQDGKWG